MSTQQKGVTMLKLPLYLDYQASTPVDPRVVDAMIPYLTEKFGNPHSASHKFGWEAEAAIDLASNYIADFLGAKENEIVFTSGATESNNLIIKGVMETFSTSKPDMVTLASEHKAVLEPAKDATERTGGTLTIVPVQASGIVDLEALRAAITDKVALVSVMTVNNEIGIIQPIKEIAAIVHDAGALFHTDAAQAYGKIPLDMEAMGIDFMSFTGHKFYAPKGIGGAYIKSNKQRLVTRQISGGSQQNYLRAGTMSPVLCVALAKATEIVEQEMSQEAGRLTQLMDELRGKLIDNIEGLKINGDSKQSWCGNLNICLPGLKIEDLMSNLRDIAISSGSACSSATKNPSHVLKAIGLSDDDASSTLRIGLGRFTSQEEVAYAAERIIKVVQDLGGVKSC